MSVVWLVGSGCVCSTEIEEGFYMGLSYSGVNEHVIVNVRAFVVWRMMI